MTKSSIVEFVIPSDAKHITADQTSVACACPDCLRARDVSMVWPLTSEFVTIVENDHYPAWRLRQLNWAIEWTEEWKFGCFETEEWFEELVKRGLVGKVRQGLDKQDCGWNYPTPFYCGFRRKELTKWLKPTNTLALLPHVKS